MEKVGAYGVKFGLSAVEICHRYRNLSEELFVIQCLDSTGQRALRLYLMFRSPVAISVFIGVMNVGIPKIYSVA